MAKSAVATRTRNSRRSVHHVLNDIAQERGKLSEQHTEEALCELRDNYGVPIMVIPSKRGSNKDRRGVDIEIRGLDPLHARFGIDVKSSYRGVREYQDKQRELEDMGVRTAYPRYPFLFNHQPVQQLQFELFKLILEKSKNCRHLAETLPSYDEIEGIQFEDHFRCLIKSIFN